MKRKYPPPYTRFDLKLMMSKRALFFQPTIRYLPLGNVQHDNYRVNTLLLTRVAHCLEAFFLPGE